jgi:hypothetical protein
LPQTVTRFPSRSPVQRQVEQVWCRSLFHRKEFTKASSSGLKSEKIVWDATKISFCFARLSFVGVLKRSTRVDSEPRFAGELKVIRDKKERFIKSRDAGRRWTGRSSNAERVGIRKGRGV